MSNWEQEITAWDRDAFQTINEGLKGPVLDSVLPHVSDLGLGYVQVPFILALALYVSVRRGEISARNWLGGTWRAIVGRRWALTFLLAFAIGGIGSILFKEAIV